MPDLSDIKRKGAQMRAAMQMARDLELMTEFVDVHQVHRLRVSSALPHALCVTCGVFWEPVGREQSLHDRPLAA